MNQQSQSTSYWKNGIVGAALAVLLGLLVAMTPLGQGWTDLSFDMPFRFRDSFRDPLPARDVKIIYLDEASAISRNQPFDYAAWDRKEHALLLDRLRECGAKAVVFDILFDRPSTSDDIFLNAIRRAEKAGTKVIIGGKANRVVTGHIEMTNVIAPEPFEKVVQWGLAELGVNTEPLRQHFPGVDGIPSLAWRAAQLTSTNPPPPPNVERWINYYGRPGYLDNGNFADALDVSVTSTNTFVRQVCFVGAHPGGTTTFAGPMQADQWPTPYPHAKAPGVEITATVYLNLVKGDWLRRLSQLNEALLLIATGILFGFGLALCRPITAVGLGMLAAVAVSVAAWEWAWHSRIWFSWMAIAGLQIPMAVAWSALAYTKRVIREKTILEEKLATHVTEPLGVQVSPALQEAETVRQPGLPSVALADLIPAIPDHTMLRRVGKGAYGEVWLARNAIGTFHAVKIIRREDFEGAEPFEREFRGLQKFMPVSHAHPGLILVLHVGRHDSQGFVYYIMEAADDEKTGSKINPDSYSPKNLAGEIRRRGHLPAAECRQLGLDLSAALDFLHQQHLIHRDIKPANIIFVRGQPKLADIGLVTEIASTGQQVTYLGTKGYIAPEGPGTPAADVYSLGKVLYEAAMGLGCEEFPEIPSTLVQRPDHAELLQLNHVLLKACRQNASQRYQTAAQMREDLLGLWVVT